MADKKISQLDVLAGADLADDDEFPVRDKSASITKKMTKLGLLTGLFKNLLTTDGDILTRSGGELARITRANLFADPAATARFGSAAVGGYAPRARIRSRRGVSVITSFASGHGWTNPLGGGGTITDDTTVYLAGTQSARINTPANASAAVQKTGLAVNMTGRILGVWIRVTDTSTIDQINVYAADSGFAAYKAWTFARGTDASPLFRSGEWQFITLPWGQAATTGSPTRSNVDTIRVKANSVAGSASVVHVGQVVSLPEPAAWSSGVCSIMFDDGKSSQYGAAKTLAKYGMSASVGIIPQSLGLATFLTTTQLREMVDLYGWEVVVHGNPDLTGLAADALVTELQGAKQYLIDQGFAGPGIDHYVYPGGQTNQTVIDAASKLYVSGRTIANPELHESFPPADPYKIRSVSSISSFSGGVTPATVATYLTNAVANKHWLILVFHNVVAGSATTTTEISQADLDTVLASVVSSGITVAPYGEVLATMT